MKRIVRVIALTGLFASVSLTAEATQNWGTIYSSLGDGYGNYYDAGATYAQNDDQHKKNNSGSDGIYINTVSQFYTAQGFYTGQLTRTSGRTTSHSYVSGSSRANLRSDSNVAKGFINVCEDRSYQADPCSDAQALPHFGY